MRERPSQELQKIVENASVRAEIFFDETSDEATLALQLESLDSLLGTIKPLIERLERDQEDEVANREAESILKKFGPDAREEKQEWCRKVIDDRFDTVVDVPHQRPICKLTYIDHVNPADQRDAYIEKYGFRFETFSDLLRESGFWQRVGPALDQAGVVKNKRDWADYSLSIRDPDFGAIFNALNGGAPIDYESLFPEARDLGLLLKEEKFHHPKNSLAYPERPSRLSVSDIFAAFVIEKLNASLSPADQDRARELSAKILDNAVHNKERVAMYKELDELYGAHPSEKENIKLSDLLERSMENLSLPENHPGKANSLEDIKEKWGSVDAVVVLASYEGGLQGYFAREPLNAFPEAFAIPAGKQQPHDVKEDGGARAQFSEADETIAALLVDTYDQKFKGMPGLKPLGDFPPVVPFDILIPDEQSVDTEGNARFVARRLEALAKIKGRSLNVLVTANSAHASRVYAEFRRVVPESVAPRLAVYAHSGYPPITNIGERRKPEGITYMFSEYVKRLYMTSLQHV